MSLRVADRVEDWDQRSFDGGYATLRDFADADFSGVVRAAGAELWMTSGAVVGIEHGSIEDFETASGTAYEAPVPALPLLAVMQAADADVRAQYYTEETPISEVEGTLSDGGFTGYLELSENVLSGDYFLVFHGGNSMSVGFVGASEQLISGDEAFETAEDEVGIYKVRQVDVEPIEIPEAGDAGGAAGGAAAVDESESGGPEDEPEDAAADADAAESADSEPDDAEPASDETPDTEPDEPEPAASSESGDAAEASGGAAVAEAEPDARQESTASAADQVAEVDNGGAAETASRSDGAASGQQRSTGASTADSSRRSDDAAAGGGTDGGGRSSGGTASRATQRTDASSGGQAGDLETRAIPSLDPDMTSVPSRQRNTSSQPQARAERSPEPAAGGNPGGATGAPAEAQPPEGQAAAEPAAEPAGGGAGDLAELEDELAEKEAEIDRLEDELDDAEADRQELEAELEEVVAERDELAEEVDRLDEELRRLEEELGAATDAERRMTPGEAVEGTNLFVDYDSKGAATLEDAHGGSESREEVAENLQLGVHTEFEESNVAVNGQEFDEFLRSTLHYRFAEWLVSTLLFEIRDTGHAEALTDLYDAIPEIRRVEFNGAIDVEYTEDGQEKGGRERFDVIFRHRMGDPLVVANLNDSRDPATGGMMETLVTSGERVGQTADSLASAFLVTSSFFESEALETVSQATQGGILSRDKRTSFVNLSRKSGYHLCLVAAREGNFHMEVPEL